MGRFAPLVWFIRPYRGRFFLLIFLIILLALLVPATPLLIQYTIDHHIATGNYQGLTRMVMLMLGLLIVQAFIQFSNTYLSGWLGQHIIRDIRIQLFRHLTHLRLKFYDNTPIGRLVTRNISDIETLADVFTEGLAAISGDMLQIIVILGIMLWTDWRLTLVSLALLPLLLISTYIFKEKSRIPLMKYERP